MTAKKEPAVILLFDGASGQYIPQRFARELLREHISGVSDDDYATLEAGPDHEYYWDTWSGVLDDATLTIGADKYTLYQNDDVWALCADRMDVEERQNFFDESEEEAKRTVYERDDKLIMLDAPSCWASYLINDDASGLEDSEQRACDAWLASEKLGAPVDCFDAGFCSHHDAAGFALAGDCQTYVFLKTE